MLGVEHSASGKRWEAREYDSKTAEAISQRFNIDYAVAASINARGISLDKAEDYINPRIKNMLPNPSIFKDMDKAIDCFIKAVGKGDKIVIFGDYDVDGATSGATLVNFCRVIKAKNVFCYIPDRMKEGYGLNPASVERFAKEGYKLIVCVDCGIGSHEAVEEADKLGIKVIVLDHHTAEITLPKAEAIVNPNRFDESEEAKEYSQLAAIGVVFLFVVGLNRELRKIGYYKNEKEPNILEFLDLVALGTICDVVSLTGLNRCLVSQGLKIAKKRENLGIYALSEVSRCNNIDAYAMGFILGPRINAGGRIGKSDLGMKLLTADKDTEAREYAKELDDFNEERKLIEENILKEADKLSFDEGDAIIFAASADWHIGVIGITASRLKEKYNAPAIVVSVKDGIGKGSCRSVKGINIGEHILAAKQKNILMNGGGHKMAAGFTVAEEKIPELKEFLNERIKAHLSEHKIVPVLNIDGIISGANISPDFAESLQILAPFGAGNPEPMFAMPDCRIIRADIVKDKHVSVIIQQGGKSFKGIAFRAMENGLGQILLQKPEKIHIAGYVRINEWQGNKSVNLQISDACV
ncbi:MAG: single-stranded-DNA-specific exonuclease RecJ [Alphaproteobacteria bacterium]|nr:single-stranded-DNA-specific exonuclease RecJ [Alphaproteobacteria bacterium]MCL2505036.1 single-stranded-DNA-specific exonuclease RecJ [Alphaproteobacteria bacterium]